MPTWPTLSTTLSLQRERNPTSFSYLRAKRDVVLMGGNEVGRWSAMLRQRLTGAVRNAILSLPCGINSTGRVLPLQGRSWRFESVIPHQQERALGVRPRSSLFRISTWAVARSQIRWRSQRFLLEHRLGLLGTHRAATSFGAGIGLYTSIRSNLVDLQRPLGCVLGLPNKSRQNRHNQFSYATVEVAPTQH